MSDLFGRAPAICLRPRGLPTKPVQYFPTSSASSIGGVGAFALSFPSVGGWRRPLGGLPRRCPELLSKGRLHRPRRPGPPKEKGYRFRPSRRSHLSQQETEKISPHDKIRPWNPQIISDKSITPIGRSTVNPSPYSTEMGRPNSRARASRNAINAGEEIGVEGWSSSLPV